MAVRAVRRFILGVLIGLFLLADLFVPGLFWRPYDWDLLQYMACFCAGGLVAEVCLSAIWGALSCQQAKYRIPLSMVMLLLIACSYIFGLQIPDLPNSTMPLAVALVVIGMGLAMYAALLVPLWIVRRVARLQIAVPAEYHSRSGSQASSQFGLRYLLMCPVVVSAVILLIQYSLPREPGARMPALVELFQIMFFAGLFIAFSMLVCIPCVWVTLSDKRRRLWAVLPGLVWLGGPWCILVALESQMGIRNPMESILWMMAFGAGLLMTAVFGLFVLRLLGYRLIGPGGGGCPFREVGGDAGECSFEKDPVAPLHTPDPPVISSTE